MAADADKNEKYALVYYTHGVMQATKRELRRLADQLENCFELFVSGCCPARDTLESLGGDRITAAAYIRDDLRELPYPERLRVTNWETLRQSPDLAMMRFYRDNPNYKSYIFIEYDVRYSGSWKDFFADVLASEPDLLFANAFRHVPDHAWPHWKSFQSGSTQIAQDRLVGGYLPVCGVSNRLMKIIDDLCAQGWNGHNEVLWPTIAELSGFRLEEIGGEGPFTPAARRGKYYGFASIPGIMRLGTFGVWPIYSDKNDFFHFSKDVLWHPVKE